jgi:hypothetical protein
MPDYKKLHDEWKEAKKTAKLFHEAVAKMHMDVSKAHQEVKIGLGAFPKFDLDLGPSLDKIEKGKDVAKAKKQAEKALKQYEKDIKGLIAVVSKLPDVGAGRPTEIQEGYRKYLPKFAALRDKIEKAVETVKE